MKIWISLVGLLSDKLGNTMKSEIQEKYNMGRELGYDMLDALSKQTNEGPAPIHFVGALTSIFECITFFEPKKERVDRLISTALDTARENAEVKS